jgi:hypothetical protein
MPMPLLSAFMQKHAAPSPGERRLLLCAAVVAVALLSFYVQLLHDSLARGDELREIQRTTGLHKPARTLASAAPGASPGAVTAQRTADARAR